MGKMLVNKLVVDKEILLKDFVGTIEVTSDVAVLNVEGACTLYEIITNYHKDIAINIKKNASLVYNRFVLNPLDYGKLEINHEDGASSIFNEGIICNKDYQMDLNVYENNSNIKSKVLVRVITENNARVKINASGYVAKDTLNNEITEDLRAFNTGISKVEILPNLIVDSNDVVANHNATISSVFDEELFYLNSKGINNVEAIKLLKNGFLLSIYNDNNFKENIKKYL